MSEIKIKKKIEQTEELELPREMVDALIRQYLSETYGPRWQKAAIYIYESNPDKWDTTHIVIEAKLHTNTEE
jgi:histone H3/H4